MGNNRPRSDRVLLVARPHSGRPVAATLRRAGFEVHRTPCDVDLADLAIRLRPRLVIVILDLPWGDAFAAVELLLDGAWVGPLLLLGETGRDSRVDRLPHLPLDVDDLRLLDAVQSLTRFTVPERST